MMKRFSKIEISCLIVFVIIAILCFIWYFLYAYFADPEIALKGEDVVTVDLKGNYKEQGAEAYLDGKNISDRVKIKSNLNTRVVGDYQVTYEVTNLKGRRAKK